ncbi:MAG: hypothetical protein WKF54_10435 [Nocardioidaceae bacterium]
MLADDEFIEASEPPMPRVSRSRLGAQVAASGSSATASADLEHRLEAVRAAAAHAFPVADVKEMAAEIERGYVSR